MAKAIVNTVRPKAKETPSNPMPTSGKAAARTALPHPPRTNQNVPMNSATYFFMGFPFRKNCIHIFIDLLLSFVPVVS
jgi:hypothetical protein